MSVPRLSAPLPEAFSSRMRELLGSKEYSAFEESFLSPRTYGLRINPCKISPDEFEKIVPFPVTPIPFLPGGYYYDGQSHPSRCPLYHAGLYYLQDPAAMLPGSLIPIRPGDRLLDLCAAPGGKATAAGARLFGQGLLTANDISAPRAKALLRNLELFGIQNVFVSNNDPAVLEKHFPEYFDAVLLDAPCSGEGMFRKDPSLLADWSEEKSEALSSLQTKLLDSALSMLRPGGYIMYSTCTYAPCEDEAVIARALMTHPGLRLCEIPQKEGFSHGIPSLAGENPELAKCIRIYPHRLRAEGHFMALLQKGDDFRPYSRTDVVQNSPAVQKSRKGKKKQTAPAISQEALALLKSFFREAGILTIQGKAPEESLLEERAGKIYLLPEQMRFDTERFTGLTFLRNGLYLGELKKNRFEPSHPFCLALTKDDISGGIRLSVTDDRLIRYLDGEPVPVGQDECPQKGWQILSVEGYPLGFGKMTGSILKNKLPAGWRRG